MQTLLNQLKIKADVVKSENNDIVSKYYLRLRPGAKVSQIENCSTEIALGLKSYGKPIIKVITEKGLVEIEVLTNPIKLINFSDIACDDESLRIPLILGKSHCGNNLIADLSEMPHLLIAGTTGSGKSVLLHSILSGILKYRPNVRLALIDPKMVELSCYRNVGQLMYPVITDSDDALHALSDLVEEMETRFKVMARRSVNNISKINKFPYIVVVIDEFSDLMHKSKKEFSNKICALAQKSRACGIHIIIATQRPSVDVVTGLIKANFPARISFKVSSMQDSRIILGSNGAEKLLGKGDGLLCSTGYEMERFQGAFISQEEISKICEYNKRNAWSRVINFFA